MKLFFKACIVIFSIASNAQNIKFTSSELYPEGTGYSNKNKSFYVTSLHYGKIGKVSSEGVYSLFIDDKDIISAIGLLVHDNSNTLYVAISDPGVSVKTSTATQMKLAKVGAYDLTTGKRIYLADLGALNTNGGNFANDLTIDEAGNVYVTNSFAPIIYKIDKKGKASIFSTNEAWKGSGFNLNGITYHKDGFLLVAQSSGPLYKVDIKDPKKVSVIKTDSIVGADGLILNRKNELVVISNSQNKIFKLTTKDSWATATIDKTVQSIESFPSTGVLVSGKYYVLNAKLNEIFDPNAPKTSDFILQEIKF